MNIGLRGGLSGASLTAFVVAVDDTLTLAGGAVADGTVKTKA